MIATASLKDSLRGIQASKSKQTVKLSKILQGLEICRWFFDGIESSKMFSPVTTIAYDHQYFIPDCTQNIDADGVGSTQPFAEHLKQGISKRLPFHEELLQGDAEEEILSPQSQVSLSCLICA